MYNLLLQWGFKRRFLKNLGVFLKKQKNFVWIFVADSEEAAAIQNQLEMLSTLKYNLHHLQQREIENEALHRGIDLGEFVFIKYCRTVNTGGGGPQPPFYLVIV